MSKKNTNYSTLVNEITKLGLEMTEFEMGLAKEKNYV